MWYYQNEPLTEPPEGYLGFVYVITNKSDQRRYYGKKTFFFKKTYQVKGKKKKKLVESDWKDYYGSSPEIQKDVEELGKENFVREILYLCKTKGEMNYLELREQIDQRVLEYPDRFYNGWITVRVATGHIKNLHKK